MSVLSIREDGYGFHYGYAPEDHRQINVRQGPEDTLWRAWVGGSKVMDTATQAWGSKAEAESAALAWIKAHPVATHDETERKAS